MHGIFKMPKGKFIFMLVIGVFHVGLYIFLNIVDPEATKALLTFLILGVIFCFSAICCLLLNPKSYFCIENNIVRARYHFFKRLNCSIDDIAFVFPQVNTMSILLKNGKQHVLTGLKNSFELSSGILRKKYVLEEESPEILKEKLSFHISQRKKKVSGVIVLTILSFAFILITVLLTNAKDFPEFSKIDWLLFTIMCIAELITLIGMFRCAIRSGKLILPIEELKYRLRGSIIASQALLPNIPLCIYTNEYNWERIAICGFPNDSSVYFCVQEFANPFNLETTYTSKIHESIDQLLNEVEFSEYIDITSPMLSSQ